MDSKGRYIGQVHLSYLRHPTDDAESLIRCSPGEDGTNGFFVSCFVKAHVTQSTEVKVKRKQSATALGSTAGKRRRNDPRPGDGA